jgi:hypothetical protein
VDETKAVHAIVKGKGKTKDRLKEEAKTKVELRNVRSEMTPTPIPIPTTVEKKYVKCHALRKIVCMRMTLR